MSRSGGGGQRWGCRTNSRAGPEAAALRLAHVWTPEGGGGRASPPATLHFILGAGGEGGSKGRFAERALVGVTRLRSLAHSGQHRGRPLPGRGGGASAGALEGWTDGWTDRRMARGLGRGNGRAGRARAQRRLDGITPAWWISAGSFQSSPQCLSSPACGPQSPVSPGWGAEGVNSGSSALLHSALLDLCSPSGTGSGLPRGQRLHTPVTERRERAS